MWPSAIVGHGEAREDDQRRDAAAVRPTSPFALHATGSLARRARGRGGCRAPRDRRPIPAQPASEKRRATSSQLTTFHHASM